MRGFLIGLGVVVVLGLAGFIGLIMVSNGVEVPQETTRIEVTDALKS
ncbi:hypothetical protein [Woodsholea maritima]|nr:hypothetical protein [Woodsholea maritima]